MANGTAVGTCDLNVKAMLPNMYHYGTEVLKSQFMSWVTPKGSLLQVDRSTV